VVRDRHADHRQPNGEAAVPVSRLPGLHRLTLHERAERVAASAGLTAEEIDAQMELIAAEKEAAAAANA